LQESLRSLYPEPGPLLEIGRTFLSLHREEADLGRLATLIRAPENSSHDSVAFGNGVAGRIEADFEQGRVVMIRGWLLSSLEARICGFLELVSRR
jgi:hypothetical protein